MSREPFSTPSSLSSRFAPSSARASAVKRDSLAAELERDPQMSSAKRQQRTQAFTSHLAHASLERQLVAAHTAKTELETKLKEKDTIIERLEGDRRWLAEREKEEREEKEREQAEWAEDKCKLDSEIRSLRSSLLTLREQHADLQDEHAGLSRSTSQTITSQKSQVATLTRQVSLLETELTDVKRIAEERNRSYEELQSQLDELSAANESFVQKDTDEENWTIVREELHRQAEYMRKLETTNAKMSAELASLKEKHTSVEVLREQKRDLERRLQGYEELQEKSIRIEAELQAARREREEWASRSAEPSTPSKTPVSITQSLSALRLTHARLLEEHGSTLASLRQREAELADAENREKEAQDALEEMQLKLRSLKDKLDRTERDRILADREVGFLQAMLASYTAEESAQDGSKVDEASLQRIQQLEALLVDYKATIEQLEKELEDIGGDPAALGNIRSREDLMQELQREKAANADAQKALQEAEVASEKHLEQIEELEQTLFELRGEIGAGRHLPPGVRVLSMKENPARQWFDLSQAAMDRLKSENDALMKRLKELEQSGARGTGDSSTAEELVPRASWEVVNKEKTELEELVKQKEKRLLRLQQVFQAKSAEFREAIASILGVKLAFYPNGQVRVTSQFDLNAAFVFQPTSAGEGMKMQLVAQGDGGPEDLPQLMRYWVEQEQCIPGFLASITLECYEKSKMEKQRGYGA
ncbi:MAD-domain-containing protein [Obba rivulosa]|uniref:Spindle assembly checkpoint component MAD1 n=1 Tax=Obba rivulosa TaxID=1052685 RepID=A0A8E2B1J5_9APHY|nr:MAD-domain-containing protein [Obba rivulosa]